LTKVQRSNNGPQGESLLLEEDSRFPTGSPAAVMAEQPFEKSPKYEGEGSGMLQEGKPGNAQQAGGLGW